MADESYQDVKVAELHPGLLVAHEGVQVFGQLGDGLGVVALGLKDGDLSFPAETGRLRVVSDDSAVTF